MATVMVVMDMEMVVVAITRERRENAVLIIPSTVKWRHRRYVKSMQEKKWADLSSHGKEKRPQFAQTARF